MKKLQLNRLSGQRSLFASMAAAIILLMPFKAFVQESKVSLDGYVKEIYMFYSPEFTIPGTNYLWSNTLHNRLNFKWYASPKLTAVVEMRNRLMFGNLITKIPNFKSTLDVGWNSLSWMTAQDDSWFLHSAIDRAYLDYSTGKWQIRAGRQRVNWGLNLVWNPNDIFNTFSYFDFDYEERPGTDAIRIQYYTGVTSSAELVYKRKGNAEHSTWAGMYRFSKWEYDFQFLGGKAVNDWVLGTGWSGDIFGAGFRGEITHFEPDNSQSTQATVASVSLDYSFSNSWYLQTSLLYNSSGRTGKAGGNNLLFNPELSPKQLSYARYSLFGQVSKPITPLFTASFSGIMNPNDQSFYVGPAVTYSLLTNLELMLTGQLFYGDQGTEFGEFGRFAFGRLKWSF